MNDDRQLGKPFQDKMRCFATLILRPLGVNAIDVT